MLFTRHDLWRIFRIVAVVTAVVLTLSPTSNRAVYAASFNPEINYQGKLSDNTGAAVDDDGYNMRFRLYDVATSGSPLWTEVWCYSPDSGATCNGTGTDQRVDVINGLFSVLLGDVTSLSAVDFNDELWLEVSIGSTGTSPTWEDLSPRKKLASVPAAFQADQLDGVDSLQFLRSDEADTMNASSSATLLTIDQDGSGDILNVIGGSTEYFSITSSGATQINASTTIKADTGGTALLSIFNSADRGATIRPNSDGTGVGGVTFEAKGASPEFIFEGANVRPGTNLTYNLGSTSTVWNVVYARTISGRPNAAQGILNLTSGDAAQPVSLQIAGTEYARLHTNGFFGIGTASPTTTLDVDGDISVGGSNNELRFYEGINYIGFEAPALSADQIWVLPDSDGTGNQVLATDGSGNLSWIDGSAATGSVSAYLDLSDTPGTFTASAIPFTATDSSALLHSGDLIFDDTNDILTVGDVDIFNRGTNNTFVGQLAGNTTQTGNSNTALGTQAGSALTTGNNNIFLGSLAGQSATTDLYSTFVGANAGRNTAGHSYNTFVGFSAGQNTQNTDNTFIGAFAGSANTTGRFNTFLGRAGQGNTTASNNIAIGYLTQNTASTTSVSSVLIGNSVLRDGLGGNANTIIGNTAGRYADAGENTFIGASAGTGVSGQSTGDQNVFMGLFAGQNYQTTDRSVFIGYTAGRDSATTTLNTFIGFQAGQSALGDTNVAIGANAGISVESDGNVFVGFQSGTNNTTGYSNTFVGQDSGRNTTTGDRNTFVGHDAGFLNDTGALNTFLGWNAGDANTSGGSNVLLGVNAGGAQTTASQNTIIGMNAGLSNVTGTANVFLGYQAGGNEVGSNRLYIANSNTSDPLIYGEFDNGLLTVNGNLRIQDSSNELWFGHTSNLTHQAAIGYERAANDGDLYFKTTTNINPPLERMRITHDGLVGIGLTDPATMLEVAGDISIGGSNNELRFYEGTNYVGFEAPALSADQIWVLPGADATSSGQVLTSDGAGNLSWTTPSAGGASSYVGLSDTPGSFTASAIPFTNTGASALLHSVGLSFTDTNDILTVGGSRWFSGASSANVFLGPSAGNTAQSGESNVFIGSSGGAALTVGESNTGIGANSGLLLTSGSENIFIGSSAGSAVTTGNNNILIGVDVFGSAGVSNSLNIGNLLYGDLSASQLSVGTSTLSHTLAVMGTFDVNSGAINYATSTNITSIERLNLGNIEFEENAGAVSWFDLPVTSAAATGTIMSYVAQIDSNEILKLYSESDGSGGIDTTRVVVGSASSAVLGSSNIPDGSLIVAGGALCVDDGSAANCDDAALTSGQIYAESTSVTAIDLAENFPTRDPSLEAAELVMLDPDNPVFVKTYDPADPNARLLGVVSTKPGVLLGGFGGERFQEDRKVPVALAGRVPVKVMLSETGPVEVGDRLSMSGVPGVATRAGAFDQTVGIALEPIEDGTEGVQEILVFVNLQNGGSEGAGGVVGLNDQLRAFGVQIGQEVTRIARLIVGRLTVGTAQNPTGITIYDMNTRQPYCIKILNGQHVATPGACEEVDTTNFFENTGGVESASSTDGGSTPTPELGTESNAGANNGDSSETSNPPAETPSSTDTGGTGSTPTSTDSGAVNTSTSTTSGAPTTTSSGAGTSAPTSTDSGAGSAPTTTDSGTNPPVSEPEAAPEPEPEPEPVIEPTSPAPTSTPSSTSSS